MKIKALFCVFILCSSLVGREVDGNHDFQIWGQQTYLQPFGTKKQFILEAQERWGGNASTLFNYHFQTNVVMQLNPWLELAPGYRQTFFLDLAQNLWRPIYEPMIFVNMKWSCGQWELDCRHQLQYRIFEHGHPLLLYRFRPRLFLPFKFGKSGIRSYLFDEIFVSEDVGVSQNRAAIGLLVPLDSPVTVSAEYFFRSLKREGWDSQSVIRFYLALLF